MIYAFETATLRNLLLCHVKNRRVPPEAQDLSLFSKIRIQIIEVQTSKQGRIHRLNWKDPSGLPSRSPSTIPFKFCLPEDWRKSADPSTARGARQGREVMSTTHKQTDRHNKTQQDTTKHNKTATQTDRQPARVCGSSLRLAFCHLAACNVG